MSDSRARLHAVVRGRVQGVGFRDFVMRRGRFLGLDGHVRNMPDGRSVEIVAEGERADVEQMLEYLRDGPRLARVDVVETDWQQPTGEYRSFGVAY